MEYYKNYQKGPETIEGEWEDRFIRLLNKLQKILLSENAIVFFELDSKSYKFAYPAFIEQEKLYLDKAAFFLLLKDPEAVPFFVFQLLYFSEYGVVLKNSPIYQKSLPFSIFKMNVYSEMDAINQFFTLTMHPDMQNSDLLGRAERYQLLLIYSSLIDSFFSYFFHQLDEQNRKTFRARAPNPKKKFDEDSLRERENALNFRLLFRPIRYVTAVDWSSPEEILLYGINEYLKLATKNRSYISRSRENLDSLRNYALHILINTLTEMDLLSYTDPLIENYSSKNTFFYTNTLGYARKDKARRKLKILQSFISDPDSITKRGNADKLVSSILNRYMAETRLLISLWPEEFLDLPMHQQVLDLFEECCTVLEIDVDLDRLKILLETPLLNVLKNLLGVYNTLVASRR